MRRSRGQTPTSPPLLYIGTDTEKAGKGIYVARFDPVSGHIDAPVLAAATVRPAFFAFAPARAGKRVVFVGNEAADASASITSWSVDAATGMLTQIGSVSSGAPGPCFVSVDLTGQAVFAADYAGSAVVSYRVLPDGTLSPPVDLIDFKDRNRFGALGPQHDRQDAAHPHSATISPDNRFVVVNDLGTDRIWIFPFDAATAKLGEPGFHQLAGGSGPRHVAFHPNGRWLYGIDELANRIDQYLWTATHAESGSQAMLVDTGHSVPTVAPGYRGKLPNTAAEVAVSDDGRFLYASNRGEETLVVFALDPRSGALKLVQRLGCGGNGPRQFSFDATGRWLFCGNQLSSSVTLFSRDAAGGRLNGPLQTLAVESPMFTLLA
jgi:6-phosphogluconolactonase